MTADEWRLEAAQCEVIEAVLRAYDAQLASLPVHKIEAAKVRLGRMLETGKFSRPGCDAGVSIGTFGRRSANYVIKILARHAVLR